MEDARLLTPGSDRLWVAGEGSFMLASELVREWSAETILRLIRQHRATSSGQRLKDCFGTQVTRVPLADTERVSGLGPEVVVKEVPLPARRRWFIRVGGRSRFCRDFRRAAVLRGLGVRVPRYLACSSRPRGSTEIQISEHIDALTLRERLWMKDTALATSSARRGLIETVAKWIARIHTRGIWQRDLKPHNVLVPCAGDETGEPVMLDITAVRHLVGPVSAERCARNLGQIIDVPVPLDREIGAPLLAAYMREAGIEDQFGAWRRSVYEEVERRRAHRLQADGYRSIDEPLSVLEPGPRESGH